MEKGTSYNGIINIIKPPGMSSSGVVVFLKGLLHFKRIGHAGTLDPGAAGVLCVALGRSARLSELLMDRKKEYIAECAFGCATATLDSYGEVTCRKECDIDEVKLKEVLKRFQGEILQVPPAYSAVKIDGTKSYKLARRGIDAPKKPPRKAFIYELDLLKKTAKNRFLIRVKCSKGTYVRVLIEDIGKALDVPSHMSFLLRTVSGGQDIRAAYTIDEIKIMKENGDLSFIKPPESVLSEMQSVTVLDVQAERLKNGLTQRIKPPCRGDFLVYSKDDGLIGIANSCEEGIKLKISLY